MSYVLVVRAAMWVRNVVLITVLLIITNVPFTGRANPSINLLERGKESDCTLYAKARRIKYFVRIDSNREGLPDNIKQNGTIDFGLARFSPSECKKFFDPEFVLLQPVNDGFWYDKADLIHEDDLQRIKHWKTRYWYVNYTDNVVGAELGSRSKELRINSALEIEAYTAKNIRNSTSSLRGKIHLFSADGRYYDSETKIWWELFLAPEGYLVLKDPTRKYLPQGLDDTSFLDFYCDDVTPENSSCGFRARNPGWRSGSNPVAKPIASPPEFTPIRVTPDKIILTRRLSSFSPYGSREKETYAETFVFVADFDDPIRPVVFAPGVLFKSTAKPIVRGQYRPQDLVNKEVCLLDCPDQLELQGLTKLQN